MNAPTRLSAGAQADPLAALRAVHLPEQVGWWPPAPGWWIVLALVVGVAVLAAIVVRRRRASLARHALRELERIDGQTSDLQAFAMAVSELLRRVALRRFGRTRVASLHGSDWQAFLSETGPRGKRRAGSFSADVGRLLALAPYAPPGFADPALEGVARGRDGVRSAARDWIRWNS